MAGTPNDRETESVVAFVARRGKLLHLALGPGVAGPCLRALRRYRERYPGDAARVRLFVDDRRAFVVHRGGVSDGGLEARRQAFGAMMDEQWEGVR